MNKFKLLLVVFTFFIPLKYTFSKTAQDYTFVIDYLNLDKEGNYFIERICVDGYVYLNMYQKKPVMTIKGGDHTALTKFPVLQSTTQSFISIDGNSIPQECGGKKSKSLGKDKFKF